MRASIRWPADARCLASDAFDAIRFEDLFMFVTRVLRRGAVVLGAAAALMSGATEAKDITLLNVSYDPTRELYADYNKAFAAHWKAKTGDTVIVKQSHGGS